MKISKNSKISLIDDTGQFQFFENEKIHNEKTRVLIIFEMKSKFRKLKMLKSPIFYKKNNEMETKPRYISLL